MLDRIAESGSGWTCGIMHAAGLDIFEMQACGSLTSRYVLGLTVAGAISLMLGVALAYFLVGRPE